VRDDICYAAYGMCFFWQGGTSVNVDHVQRALKFFALARAPNSDASRCAAECATQADLIREIFGNPFRPTSFGSAFPGGNGGTVVQLATAAYEERVLPAGTLDSVRLRLLADTLEEAGCTDRAVLDHLRGPGGHVRGCWALDRILGTG